MASDILVMMPLLCLLPGLRINRKEKVALTSIFSLSAIVIIVAIIRVIQTSATTQHVDPVWLALWSSIESSVGQNTPFSPNAVLDFLTDGPSCSGHGVLPSMLPRPARQTLPVFRRLRSQTIHQRLHPTRTLLASHPIGSDLSASEGVLGC